MIPQNDTKVVNKILNLMIENKESPDKVFQEYLRLMDITNTKKYSYRYIKWDNWTNLFTIVKDKIKVKFQEFDTCMWRAINPFITN